MAAERQTGGGAAIQQSAKSSSERCFVAHVHSSHVMVLSPLPGDLVPARLHASFLAAACGRTHYPSARSGATVIGIHEDAPASLPIVHIELFFWYRKASGVVNPIVDNLCTFR
jgi:hypothetical protein